MTSGRSVTVVGLKQETASFNPAPTTLEDFDVVEGAAAARALAGTRTEVGGIIAGAPGAGFELRFGTIGWALSGGPVRSSAWHLLADRILADVERYDSDGVLVVLHGSMVTPDDEDPDGTLLGLIRDRVGERPVVATLDLHVVLTDAMLDHADVLVPFHTYPHTDHAETGGRAVRALRRVLDGALPVTALARLPLLARGDELLTDSGLLGQWVATCQALEREGALAAGVQVGNPFTDVSALSTSVLLTTDGDEATAAGAVRELAGRIWRARGRLRADLTPVPDAVASSAGPGLTVLADQADATSSGSSGDSPTLLRELVRTGGGRPALVPLVDAPAARLAFAVGVGGRADFRLGGSIDHRHEPVSMPATVLRLYPDSVFEYEDGIPGRAGDTAVLEYDGVQVLVTSRAIWFVGQRFYLAHDMHPDAARVVVVKSPNGFRPHYAAIADRIIVTDGEGATSAALDRLPYRNVTRPIEPLDVVPNDQALLALRPQVWAGRRPTAHRR